MTTVPAAAQPQPPPPPIHVSYHAPSAQHAPIGTQHYHQPQQPLLQQQIHPGPNSYTADYGSLVGSLGPDAAYYGQANPQFHSFSQNQQLQSPANTAGNTPSRSQNYGPVNNLGLNDMDLHHGDVLQLQNRQTNVLNVSTSVPSTATIFQANPQLAMPLQKKRGSVVADSLVGDDDFDEGGNGKTLETNEKRARRRASHNAVERRRRDIINEKINELSTLLPDHHLLPADAQNKGSILKRSVDHMRGVQAMAGRQADRIIELENVCRILMQKAGITDDAELGLSLPLGTSFVLRVSGMPGGEITGNQLAGALLAAAQSNLNTNSGGASNLRGVHVGASMDAEKSGLVSGLMGFGTAGTVGQRPNGLGLLGIGDGNASAYGGEANAMSFPSL
ncbi:hypothetical protein HDU84_004442 [Entophlyctis sp. JEL0112]|nr:hypothetical protein HDU84_004442 [Entophlyctis sp. JEL0112]